jgi:pilus assembly protein CpaF
VISLVRKPGSSGIGEAFSRLMNPSGSGINVAPAPEPQPVAEKTFTPAPTEAPPCIEDPARIARDKFRFRVVDEMLPKVEEIADAEERKTWVAGKLDELFGRIGAKMPADQLEVMRLEIEDELLGFGPLGAILRDQDISEVMVNGPNQVFVEMKGRVVETDITFRDDAHVLLIIDRIVKPLGRTIDRKLPLVDARLPDGSRVNAIVPPCAIDGPSLTIRKFKKDKLKIEDLIRFGALTPAMAEFIQGAVKAGLNVVVSGGTGSGKTTLLNVLSSFIPGHERIVTIEDSAELQLQQRHVVRLETKPAERDGSSKAVAIRDLVINALRMRPERIVVGECRGGETLDMLQAMNTGHDGSMTTAHSNTPRDCIARLETMTMMSGMDLPLRVIRNQIAGAVNLIVQATRLRDGSRKVTCISEVTGMEGETICMQHLFQFHETGYDAENNKVQGEHRTGGYRPACLKRLEGAGVKFSANLFDK